MPVLREPLAAADRRLLRSAVVTMAGDDHRRRVRAAVHVGLPGGEVISLVDDPRWDHGLRTELVGAMLRARRDPPWVWVTRSGPLSVQDVDMAWLGPAVAAAAERRTEIAYVVVTRHGWSDPRSGLRQEWKRIRRR